MNIIYKAHIYIAERGTPKLDPVYAPKIVPTWETATMGHMWYSIQQGNEDEQCYVFAPVNNKDTLFTSVSGKIFTNDNDAYYKPRYKRTMVIEQEKYQKLQEFGKAKRIRENNKFEDQYYAPTNSCVDFTWLALRYAGFWWYESAYTTFDSDSGVEIKHEEYQGTIINYEGRLIPSSNWDDVKRIINPSNLNQELKQFEHLNISHLNLSPIYTILDLHRDISPTVLDKIKKEQQANDKMSIMRLNQILKESYKQYVKENPLPQKEENDELNTKTQNLEAQIQPTNLSNLQQDQPTKSEQTANQAQAKGVAHLSSQIACRNCGVPVTVAISSSPNVFINGKPALRVGDYVAPYTCPVYLTISNGGKIQTGSSSIFINGMQLALIGSKTEDGSTIINGSSNVFIGS